MLHIQLDEQTREYDLSYSEDNDQKVIERSIAISHYQAALWPTYNFMANDIFNSITVYMKLNDKDLIPLTINRCSIYENRNVVFSESRELAISHLDKCDLASEQIESQLVTIINYIRQTQPTVNQELIFGKEHPQIVLRITKRDDAYHDIATLIYLSKTPVVEMETIKNILVSHG